MDGPRTTPAERYQVLGRNLEVLASPIRLALLSQLRKPTPLHQIRIEAPEDEQHTGRALSRQAVSWHLNQLLEAGLVHRLPGEGRSQMYVLNHERVFALIDEMRDLSRLRPLARHEPGATLDAGSAAGPSLPPPPRLLLVYGRNDGMAFPLDGEVVLGREPGCEVRLDYDPYASGRHARIRVTGGAFFVEDLGSRNGTYVNGEAVNIKEPRRLRPGDVLMVGRSQLAFQDQTP